MSRPRPFRLAVELSGAGRHPAAWRLPDAHAADVFTASYWVRLARDVERAGATLLLLDDDAAPVVERPGALVGRLDPAGVAALLGPLTTRVGLAPVVPVTYLEPFHVGKAVQTLDHVSAGRGAVQIDVAAPAGAPTADAEASRYDARAPRDLDALWREADDVAEVAERLWDSWEDDAIVLDAATDRYVDRDRIHAVEFGGEFFAVHGASITPRSPQGRAVVVVRGDSPEALAVAARRADVVRVALPPVDGGLAAAADAAAERVADVRRAVEAAGRDTADVTVLLDVDVLLAVDDDVAAERRHALAALTPTATSVDGLTTDASALVDGLLPDASVLVGGVLTVTDALADLVTRTDADGVTVRSLAHATDVPLLADGVAPLLRERGLLVEPPATGTLRDALGLPRPASRYATAR